MFKLLTGIIICAASIFIPLSASAQVAELRFGVAQFDERILDIGLAAQEGEETSVAIHGEILFDEIPLYKRLSDPSDILKWALSPQPYIGGAVNLGGFTSYGGGGFLWRQKLGHKAYVDIASGGVLRTGTNGLDEEVLSGPNREIIFGSRFLFRQQFALGLNLSEQWSGEIFFEHLSNAGLGFVNEGGDSVGFRLVRKL